MPIILLQLLYYYYILKMAIEIVSFPIKNGGSFHSYVSLPEGIYYYILLLVITLCFIHSSGSEAQLLDSGAWLVTGYQAACRALIGVIQHGKNRQFSSNEKLYIYIYIIYIRMFIDIQICDIELCTSCSEGDGGKDTYVYIYTYTCICYRYVVILKVLK